MNLSHIKNNSKVKSELVNLKHQVNIVDSCIQNSKLDIRQGRRYLNSTTFDDYELAYDCPIKILYRRSNTTAVGFIIRNTPVVLSKYITEIYGANTTRIGKLAAFMHTAIHTTGPEVYQAINKLIFVNVVDNLELDKETINLAHIYIHIANQIQEIQNKSIEIINITCKLSQSKIYTVQFDPNIMSEIISKQKSLELHVRNQTKPEVSSIDPKYKEQCSNCAFELNCNTQVVNNTKTEVLF